MTDTVDTKTRSKIMSSVKSKDTQIELIVRKALFAKGFRYKINDKTLPGKPDIALPKYKAVIFINGCFWHGHNCKRGKLPETNTDFWSQKINSNIVRDKQNIKQLKNLGWRVAVVWECSLRGKTSMGLQTVAGKLESWLKNTSNYIEIPYT